MLMLLHVNRAATWPIGVEGGAPGGTRPRGGRMLPMSNFRSRPLLRHLALVPAAGSGSRMGAERPKQYLPLLGRPLIHHTLAALCGAPAIDRVYVVLSVGDQEWDRHDWSCLRSEEHTSELQSPKD